MKGTIVRFNCSCLLLLFIVGGAKAQGQRGSLPVSAAIAGATIAEWKGNIHLSLPGQAWSSPLPGERLPAGTVLDSGGGKLLLRLSDGSEVLVRPHTKLQVRQPSLTDPSYLQLLLGRIRALINQRTGGTVPFELGTPSAVIAVRGTQFDVEINRQSMTEVDVIDGLVEVSGRKPGAESVLVEPGFSTRVGLDSGPEQPQPTNEIRPEVERPEQGENEIRGKSGLEAEFERAEAEREIETKESAEIAERTELREIREISERAAVEVEVEAKPGSEPQ